MGNPNLVPYETIVQATSGEPEAVDEVLRHYSKRIRFAALADMIPLEAAPPPLWTRSPTL
ncbi:MAG: helix-turn-helix domain-containing protein [Lachnospiraceae bacterium]|nr:helix-turn-helix domain-containing protein [Lachnospiraceae bacterium]